MLDWDYDEYPYVVYILVFMSEQLAFRSLGNGSSLPNYPIQITRATMAQLVST